MENTESLGLDDLINKYSIEINNLSAMIEDNPNDYQIQKNYYTLLKDYAVLLSKKEANRIIEESKDDKILVEFINYKTYAKYKNSIKK